MSTPEDAASFDVTAQTVRFRWRFDEVRHLADRIKAVAMKALGQDRGPIDYPEERESEFERGVRLGARYGGYKEAPKGTHTNAIIIGCTISLLTAFVLGAWKLSNDSAAIRAEFTEWKQATLRWMEQSERRLDRLENRR